MRARQYAAGLTGCLILVGTAIEAVRGSRVLYQDYYRMPMEKYGVLTPLRWQDIMVMVGFYLILMTLSYASYRLLKYAFRPQDRAAG